MIFFSIYALKVIIISGFLFGYYYFVLRNGRFHEWNRYYLILSALISLALPFARWSALFSGYSGSRRIYAVELQSFTVSTSSHVSAPASLNWTTWLLAFYLLVSVVIAGGIIAGMLKIRRRIRQGEKQKFPVFTLIRHPKTESPFSFFRFIFWNDLLAMDTPEGSHIFRHELAHVREKHSVDKLLMEIILAVFWINPFFHLIRKELHLIHEFIADRRACYDNPGAESSGYFSPQDYATLLVKQFLRTNHIGVASHFFQKQLTRRVRMLVRNNEPRFTYIKRVMAIPLILSVALIFIFLQSQAGTGPSSIHAFTTAIQKTIAPAGIHLPPQKKAESAGRDAGEEVAQSASVHLLQPVPPVLKEMTVRLLNGIHDSKIEDAGIEPAKVFTFVEQMPSFPGGEGTLMKYLSGHVRYPAAARENGIQGTVVVQFNVNPDGHLSHVTTVGKRLGGGLEQEAIRVVKTMPDWIAGKQNGKYVTVQYSLPVRFALQGDDDQADRTASKNMPAPPPPPSRTPSVNISNTSHKVFTFVEQMPSFPGGEETLMKYLHDHIHYPTVAREDGIQGTVIVQFIIDPDGHLRNITTVGRWLGGGLEQEAVRVVKTMPDWNAGVQNGQKVAVQYSLPIRFVLQ